MVSWVAVMPSMLSILTRLSLAVREPVLAIPIAPRNEPTAVSIASTSVCWITFLPYVGTAAPKTKLSNVWRVAALGSRM